MGRGKFGTVYHVVGRKDGISYASKHVKYRNLEAKQKIVAEVDLMRKLDHPRLVKMIEAFQGEREIVVVMEHLAGGELFDLVADEEFQLTEGQCRGFMRQVCEGVAHLHSLGIVHLDLKPENIVCVGSETGEIKIVDFGTAQQLVAGEELKTMCGTPEFVAPEVVNYERIGPPTDMWGVGVICYILLSGFSPFMGETDDETFSNINSVNYDFEEPEFDNITNEAKDFISSLLTRRPHMRLNAVASLQHDWLQGEEEITVMLSTEKLRHWVTRRRWQRCSKAIRAMKKMSDLMIRRRSLRATASLDLGGSWTGLAGVTPSGSAPDLGAGSQESPPPVLMRTPPADELHDRPLTSPDQRERRATGPKLPDLLREIVEVPAHAEEREERTSAPVRGMVQRRISMFENPTTIEKFSREFVEDKKYP